MPSLHVLWLLAAYALTMSMAHAQDLVLLAQPFPGTRMESRCLAIAETADGCLWFGYQDRLLRHDGVRMQSVAVTDPVTRSRVEVVHRIWASGDEVHLVSSTGIWRVEPSRSGARRLPGTEGLAAAYVGEDADGNVWSCSRRRLQLVHADGTAIDSADYEALESPRGLACYSQTAFVWTDQELIPFVEDSGRIVRRRSIALAAIRTVAASTTGLIVVTSTGIHRVGGDGSVEELIVDSACAMATGIGVGPEATWVVIGGRVWRASPQSRRLQKVEILGVDGPVNWAQVDRQGLLWLGTSTNVYRIPIYRGIDSYVLPQLLPLEDVTAMVEVDGCMWLGTSNGRLLRQEQGEWVGVDTPWKVALAKNGTPHFVVAMAALPGGKVAVATRRGGVWCRGDGWQEIEGAWLVVRGVCADAKGGLWVSADRETCYLPPDVGYGPGALERFPFAGPGRPGRAEIDEKGDVWVSAYRGGLWSKHRDQDVFQPISEHWSSDAVLNHAVDSDSDSVFLISMSGVWRLRRSTGERTLEMTNSPVTPFRLIATQAPHSLWLARSTQLIHLDPSTGAIRQLPAGCGSHPCGFTLRSSCLRNNGEIWLGANRGYTCIKANASHNLDHDVGVSRIEVQLAGKTITSAKGGTFDLDLPADGMPIWIQLTPVDRSIDTSLPYTILLQNAAQQTHSAVDGRFDSLPIDDFEVTALITESTGHSSTRVLGRIRIHAAVRSWPFWALVSAVLLGLGAMGYALATRRRQRNQHYINLPALGEVLPEVSNSIRDAAQIAISACESSSHRGLAKHSAVWLYKPDSGRRVLLARFGKTIGDSEQRTRACCDLGLVLRENMLLHYQGRSKDVVVCVRNQGDVEFEILMHDVPRLTRATVQQLQEVAAPLTAALQGQRWISRLETDMVRRTTSIAAETHDLRGPLTVLRFAAFELGQAVKSGDPSAVGIAESISAAVDRILGSFDEMLKRTKPVSGLSLRPLDPCALVNRKVAQFRPTAALKGIELELEPSPSIQPLLLDEAWFDRVLENLIGNAIKYAPSGSLVRICYQLDGAHLRIHIDDEGPGFSAVDRQKVFLPGMVGSAVPTGNESKTGMGLWIASQAIKGMGGEVWIGDRSGSGARLTVALPLH